MVSQEGLFHEALQLDQRDRADLAALLIDSLGPVTEQDLNDAWMREINRRVADLDTGSAETIPWDGVRARLRGLRG